MFAPESSLSFMSLVLLLSIGEFFLRRRRHQSYDGGAVLSTIAIAVGQFLTRTLTVGIISVALLSAQELSPFALDGDHWSTWAIGFLLVEFTYYWQHRYFHTIRWFWATHSVHHSPNEFTFPVAFRLGWTSGVSGAWLFLLAPVFLGVPPVIVAALYALNLQYQFFLHTELLGKLGPLEWVFNTPSHHRVHHGSNRIYLDKNYGGVLIIFDRLFGTFQKELATVPVRYGLTDPIYSKNPFVILFREWRNMFLDIRRSQSLGEALHAVIGRPGSFYGHPYQPGNSAKTGARRHAL